MVVCCGPRSAKDQDVTPADVRGPAAANKTKLATTAQDDRRTSAVAGAGGFVAGEMRLRVRVIRAKGLMGMDISGINAMSMKLERTLDAYMEVRINDRDPFGKTAVKWKSKGDPEWNESFQTNVRHCNSFLCISALDDDNVFSQDMAGSMALLRKCGSLEVPLWQMPTNHTVVGWFTLNHPELAEDAVGIEDRQAKLQKAKAKASSGEVVQDPDEPESAGQVLLELRLEATAMQELRSSMEVPPFFKVELQPLDLQQVISDVMEAKRIFLDRLLFAAIGSISYALSWQDKRLSTIVLCWYWFLFFYPCFIWATVWVLVLLCFWHEIPKEKSDLPPPSFKKKQQGLIDGTVSGVGAVFGGVGGSLYSVLSKPIQGVRQGGVKGLAVGLKDGVVEGAVKATTGVVTGVTGVAGGLVNTVTSVRAPGLQEFQQILMLKPTLRETVRRLQPTLNGVHSSLQAADDFFYWGSVQTTKKAVYALGGMLVSSLALCRYMGVLSWYGFLIGGSCVILAKAEAFRGFVGVTQASIGVLTRPKLPFVGCPWFELDDKAEY